MRGERERAVDARLDASASRSEQGRERERQGE